MAVPYYGDFAEDATVYIPINTFDSNDPAASVTVTNLLNTDVHIHKDGGTTQRNNAAGITMTIDYDSITGNHLLTIDTSDNTVADFWQAGHEYQVRVEGITVDSGTINAWVGSFSIERAGGALALIKSATYGLSALKTLLDTTGIKVASFANNAITANAINADAITNAKIADDAIAVENIKDAAITAAKIADAAIDNATFAADVGSTAYASNIIALAVRKVLDEIKLDHLVAVADSDDVADNSIIGKLASTDGDWSKFSDTTDALQSIRDKLPANLEDLSITDTTGIVKADLQTIAAHSIVGTGTQVADAFEKMFDVAAPVLTCESVNQAQDNATTAEIVTAMEANGSKLDHLWEMTEDDGGVRRLTTNALEQAPSGGLDAAGVAAAVWDAVASNYDDAGSMGALLNDAGASGDPWSTSLPGAYGSGTAGYILGTNLAAVYGATEKAAIDLLDDVDGGLADIHTTCNSILADTNELQTDDTPTAIAALATTLGVAGAGLTAIPWNAAWDAEVQSECTDALNAYDPPTKAELDSAQAAVTVSAIANNAITAAAIATDAIDADALKADAITEIQNGLATAAALTTVDTVVDLIEDIVRNKMEITDANGNLVLYADDSTTPLYSVAACVTDDLTTTTRKRLA